MHLDLDQPVALTGLAAPALDVKRNRPGLYPRALASGSPAEPIPDRRKGPVYRSRVGARRAPDRALVDIDHLVEMLEPFDRLTRRRRLPRAVQAHRGGFEQRLNRQRRFAAPRNAGDTDKLAQGKIGT